MESPHLITLPDNQDAPYRIRVFKHPIIIGILRGVPGFNYRVS